MIIFGALIKHFDPEEQIAVSEPQTYEAKKPFQLRQSDEEETKLITTVDYFGIRVCLFADNWKLNWNGAFSVVPEWIDINTKSLLCV